MFGTLSSYFAILATIRAIAKPNWIIILPVGQNSPTATGEYTGIDIGVVEFVLLGIALIFGLLVNTTSHAFSFKLRIAEFLNAKTSAVFSFIQCSAY